MHEVLLEGCVRCGASKQDQVQENEKLSDKVFHDITLQCPVSQIIPQSCIVLELPNDSRFLSQVRGQVTPVLEGGHHC